MLRLIADENFHGDIVRGLLLRHPDLDLVRVQDVGLSGADDAEVLAWAAENQRIVITHDQATMSDFAYERVSAGLPMPGLFVVNDRHSTRSIIDEVELLIECSDANEWPGKVIHLPL